MYAQTKNNDISNRRIAFGRRLFCIFASFSKTGTIEPELVFLLQALHNICENIAFISDNVFSDSEFDKIKDLVVYSECEKHGLYDFGSYAKGFQWFKNSKFYDETDELLFCNDSILGPYNDLNKFFEKKNLLGNPEFFGCTINYLAHKEIHSHVQTYFFTVRKEIFRSDYFSEFFKSVKKEESKTDVVINYEIGLTKMLESHNIKPRACFENRLYNDPCREFMEHFDEMFFIKKNRLKYYHIFKLNMLLKKIGFPFYIINGKFVKKSFWFTVLIILCAVFEPARLIRSTSVYKKIKYNKKLDKMTHTN